MLAPYKSGLDTKTTAVFEPDEQGRPSVTANLNKGNVDFNLQTRNYMGYSDLDDMHLYQYFETIPKLVDSPEYACAQNSINYLENAVDKATAHNKDEPKDSILPYMHDYYPIMTFVDSDEYVGLPEFYEDYPIFVSVEAYEERAMKDQYTPFYKAWYRGEGQDMQITRIGSTHRLLADIDAIEVVWVKTKSDDVKFGQLESLSSEDYTWDKDTGIFTLSAEKIAEFTKNLDAIEDEDNSYYENYFIVFKFLVEKYRSIDDIRDLTSEQVQQIATMQSIQASMLEYYYQFQVAVESQNKINEIAYTVAITVITTALTMGIGSAAHLTKKAVLSTLITEPLEEVFVDPVVEAVASRFVEMLGGDEYAQMIASTLAESGREGLGIQQQMQQRQMSQQIKTKMEAHQNDPTYTKADARQEVMAEMQQQTQEESTVSKVALMTLSIFGMIAGIGGFFGGLGGLGITSLSAFLLSTGGDVKDFFKELKEQLGIDQDILQGASQVAVSGLPSIPSYNIKLSHISDYIENMKGVFEVSDTQKPIASWTMVRKLAAMLSLQGKNLFRKKDGLYRSDAILSAIQYLANQDFDIGELTFWGALPPERIANGRPNRFTDNLFENIRPAVEYGDPLEGLDGLFYTDKSLVMDILQIILKNKNEILRDLISRVTNVEFSKTSHTGPTSRLYIPGGYELVVNHGTGGLEFSDTDDFYRIFLGVSRDTLIRWKRTFLISDFLSGDRVHTYRKIKRALFELLSLEQNSAVYAMALRNILDHYQSLWLSDLTFTDKFSFICDKYMTSSFGGVRLSRALNSHDNYITRSQWNRGRESEQQAKYFDFLTKVNIIDRTAGLSVFKDASKIDTFKEEVTELVYDTMVELKLIGDSDLVRMQFDAVAKTLYALTDIELYRNPNADLVSLRDLSYKLSSAMSGQLIQGQFRDGYPTAQIITDLGLKVDLMFYKYSGGRVCYKSCSEAQKAIREYEGKIGIERSRVGTAFHYIIQYRLFEALKSRSLISAREINTGYFGKVPNKQRVDFIIMGEDILDSSLLGLDLTVMDIVRLDFTASSSYIRIESKAEKYSTIDQTYLTVLYGVVRNFDLKGLNKRSDLRAPKPSLSGVVTIEQLASSLGLQGAALESLTNIPALYQKAYSDRRTYIWALSKGEILKNQMESGVYYAEMNKMIYEVLKNRFIGMDLMWSDEHGYYGYY